jgi:putative redox protein
VAKESKPMVMTWREGLQFEGGLEGGPTTLVDGNGAAAPSPVTTLLVALAGCTGSDIVLILEKMRVKLASFSMEVTGVRREEEPRRFLSIHLIYRLSGQGLDETKARRAIDLSLEKYCSVTHSLARDIRITYDVALG